MALGLDNVPQWVSLAVALVAAGLAVSILARWQRDKDDRLLPAAAAAGIFAFRATVDIVAGKTSMVVGSDLQALDALLDGLVILLAAATWIGFRARPAAASATRFA